jgi:hypothetical protein
VHDQGGQHQVEGAIRECQRLAQVCLQRHFRAEPLTGNAEKRGAQVDLGDGGSAADRFGGVLARTASGVWGTQIRSLGARRPTS